VGKDLGQELDSV